jgi:hypothetical protein
MTKTQFLLEARSHAKPKVQSGRSAAIRATTFLDNCGFEKDVDGMTGEEKSVFAKQVRQSLNRERRRSAARAGTYDITRHIALFLADKALRSAGI